MFEGPHLVPPLTWQFKFWLSNPSQRQFGCFGANTTAAKVRTMKVTVFIVGIFLLQNQIIFAGFTRQCLCPHHIDYYGLHLGFCGYEIIEKRASAKPSTRICKPTFAYHCEYGPNKSTFEIKCEENEKCIPGSEAYKKLKDMQNDTSMDFKSSLLRFCASKEGKTNNT